MKGKPVNNIIFITSTNLACNPRCLKEVELAYELGYDVTVFAFDMANWTRAVEKQIKERLPKLKYYSLQTSRKPFFTWLSNSLQAKFAGVIYRLGLRTTFLSAVVTDKRTLTLLSALRKSKPIGNIIIGHNPGAFYPAWWLSKKTGIPFAIDIEDYHPGENNGSVGKEAVTKLMNAILPHAEYVSFAAPMIKDATLLQFKEQKLPKPPFVINNVFSFKEFSKPEVSGNGQTDKLKLVWFSQFISFYRGLDEILPLLDLYKERMELTLIGNLDLNFKSAVLDKYNFIIVKEPIIQQDLHACLGQYDIGLALESNKSDDNRKICLTNKIWAYLQAGLCIWANNTPAQVQFASEFPKHTSIIDMDKKETVTKLIHETLNKLSQIREGKISRWEINHRISWEAENVILKNQWDKITRN